MKPPTPKVPGTPKPPAAPKAPKQAKHEKNETPAYENAEERSAKQLSMAKKLRG